MEGTPMLSIVVGDEDRSDLNLDLDAIVREGARRMLMTALRAEVDEYIGAHSGERDATDNALIVVPSPTCSAIGSRAASPPTLPSWQKASQPGSGPQAGGGAPRSWTW